MSLWSCPTCPKSFARKGDLTRHKLIHAGIKPHVCEFCGKGFAQFSGLKTHLNVHTKAKPYVCGIGTCTKAFGDPSSRARHRKETHRREGAYKCVVPDCGTKIKRRSAFVAHLRKHGLNPSLIDLDAGVRQSSKRGVSLPTHFTSPDVENKEYREIESRSVSPSFDDNPEYYNLSNAGQERCSTDNSGSSVLDPFVCRRAGWSPVNDTLLLGPILGQTVTPGLSDYPNNIYTYSFNSFEDTFCSRDMSVPLVDYPLLAVPPFNLPVMEPFLEARSGGSQSSWSSPSSTYSTLYSTGFNDDVVSFSLPDSISQESLLHNPI